MEAAGADREVGGCRFFFSSLSDQIIGGEEMGSGSFIFSCLLPSVQDTIFQTML